MAVLQKGLWYQAADQALLGNLVKAGLVDWSRAVVVYRLLRGFNQVLNPNHPLPVPQGHEVVAMIHSRALSSCQLVQGKENERKLDGCIVLSFFFWDIHPSHLFILLNIFLSCVVVHSWPKANWYFSMKLCQIPQMLLQMLFHDYLSLVPFMKSLYL